MKHRSSIITGLILSMLTLFGCGGGSNSTPVIISGGSTTPTTSNKISGVASKSLIIGGTVSIYKIVNGAKSDLIVTGTTNANGAYTLDVGTYTGPVLVEVSGGTYTDEATGSTTATIPAGAPLRAVVPSVSGTVSAAVTPLTDLAYQLAGTSLTPTAISSANTQVATIFKVTDIIKTQPVAPTSSALSASTTTQDQRDYTLALATFSQIAATQGKSVADTVTYLKDNSSGTTLTTAAVTAFQTAATTYFSASNTNNKTGVTDPSTTSLVSVGAKRVVVKLSTIGSIPSGNTIKGISADITLPAGVSVKSDANGVLASYLFASGVTPASSYLLGNISGSKLSLSLVPSTGMALGEFATLTCDVAYNAPSPLGNFAVGTSKVSDWTLNVGTVPLATVFVRLTVQP